MTIGAVVISRNDNYGGDLKEKFACTIRGLLYAFDEVYYIDWNSPDDKPLIHEIDIPITGKLHTIIITQQQAKELTNNNPDVQNCCEVFARNIGIRRLSTDYIVSTNSDILVTTKENILAGIINNTTFHTIARRETSFSDIPIIPHEELAKHLLANKDNFHQHASGSPLGERDKWSLITCPGDFQLSHRDVWHAIKGFDEDLIMRGYADSNIQRKADYYGYSQALIRNIDVFHFAHYPGSGSSGGNTAGWNDPDRALFDYKGTTNKDTWGFSYIDFKETII